MVAPFCSLIACFLNGVLPPYISVLLHTSLDKYYYYLDENFVNFLNCYVTLTTAILVRILVKKCENCTSFQGRTHPLKKIHLFSWCKTKYVPGTSGTSGTSGISRIRTRVRRRKWNFIIMGIDKLRRLILYYTTIVPATVKKEKISNFLLKKLQSSSI